MKITIAIPVYNEEKNIVSLVNSINSQKKHGFEINQIIILSDGSTDNTISEVKKIRSSNKIRIINGVKRHGKAYRLNQIFKISTSDCLLLIDGDCVLDINYLKNISEVLQKNKDIMLGCGDQKPKVVNTFFEKSIYIGVLIRNSVAQKSNPIYFYRGSAMLINKSLYKGLIIPDTQGTDAYIYLTALFKKLNITFIKKSIVYYNLPKNFGDYFKQSARFSVSRFSMSQKFGPLADSEYKIPTHILINEICKQFLNNPLYTSVYILINIVIRTYNFFASKHVGGIWQISESTKKMI